MSWMYFFNGDDVARLASISIASGSEDPDYPAINAGDWSPGIVEAKPSKLTTTSGDWLFSYAGLTIVKAVALWHNIDAGVNVRIKAGNTTATTSLDLPITIEAGLRNGFTQKVYKYLVGQTGYSGSGYQYWRISVPNNSVPLGLKVRLFNQARTFDYGIRYGYQFVDLYNTIEHRTDFGVSHFYDMKQFRRMLHVQAVMDDTDRQAVTDWYRDAFGRWKTVALIPDTTVNDIFIGRFTNTPTTMSSSASGPATSALGVTVNPEGGPLHTVEMSFEEVTAGLPEWQ